MSLTAAAGEPTTSTREEEASAMMSLVQEIRQQQREFALDELIRTYDALVDMAEQDVNNTLDRNLYENLLFVCALLFQLQDEQEQDSNHDDDEHDSPREGFPYLLSQEQSQIVSTTLERCHYMLEQLTRHGVNFVVPDGTTDGDENPTGDVYHSRNPTVEDDDNDDDVAGYYPKNVNLHYHGNGKYSWSRRPTPNVVIDLSMDRHDLANEEEELLLMAYTPIPSEGIDDAHSTRKRQKLVGLSE